MCAELLSLITQILIRYKDAVQPRWGGMWYCLASGVLVMPWCCNNCVPPSFEVLGVTHLLGCGTFSLKSDFGKRKKNYDTF